MRRRLSLAPLIAALIASTLCAEPARAGRLGRDVVPTFEAVELQVDADRSDYRGEVVVELRVERETSSFSFHSQGLEIEQLTLVGPRGPIAVTHSQERERQVEVSTEAPLSPGEYTLDISFSNEFNTKAASLYRLVTRGRAYTFTQFEADDARGAFPCWDEPSFKIPWQLTLVVPKKHLAFSNTPIESESESDGRTIVKFKKTPPLSSYLVAFATGPFEVVDIPGLSVPGHVITVRGQKHLAAEAVRITPPLLEALERYFGSRYPFEKCDLIAVPEYWYGAMENPGLITYAESALLLDPKTASAEEKSRLVRFTAHELAHMWFGDLVTMEWWDDMWLNESFASWMGNKVSDEVFPEFRARLRDLSRRDNAMRTDARLSTRAVRRPVVDADNLLQLADALSYDKGEAVLEMFEGYLGPERFRDGVRRYLEDFSWANANAADLWYALARAGRTKLEPAMASFLDQPGVPLITVERLRGDRLRLRQQRYLRDGVADPGPQLWRVPVTLKYGEGGVTRTQVVLLSARERIVKLEGGSTAQWIHPNADEGGYYRWALPEGELLALAGRASTTLSERERVALVDNLRALLESGALGADSYLGALEKLAADPLPEVGGRVVEAVREVRDVFVTPETRTLFAAYVRRTLTPMLQRIGERARPGEPGTTAKLRSELWGLLGALGEDAQLIERAERLAREYQSDPASLEPGLIDAVLRLAAIRGDRAKFDDDRRRFETAVIPAERSRYLSALGAYRDTALAEAALRYVLEGPLRPQELMEVPIGQGRTIDRQQRVFDWMLEHYSDFASRIPPMFLAFLPRVARGCSLERLEIAQKFFADPAHQAPGSDKEMKQVAESVMDCVRLRERESAAVRRFLESREPLP